MITQAKRMKRFEEIISFKDGKVLLEGKENPTAEEIGHAIMRYARQFKVSKDMDNETTFRLSRPHPKIGASKGTTMTKKEWMEEYGFDEQMFQAIKSSGYMFQLK